MVLAAVTSVLTVMEFQKPATVTRVTVANPTTAEVQSGSFNYTEWYMGKQAVAAKETSELQCMCKNPSVPISTIVDASRSFFIVISSCSSPPLFDLKKTMSCPS